MAFNSTQATTKFNSKQPTANAVAGAFDGLTKKSNKTFTYAGVKGQLNKHVNLGASMRVEMRTNLVVRT